MSSRAGTMDDTSSATEQTRRARSAGRGPASRSARFPWLFGVLSALMLVFLGRSLLARTPSSSPAVKIRAEAGSLSIRAGIVRIDLTEGQLAATAGEARTVVTFGSRAQVYPLSDPFSQISCSGGSPVQGGDDTTGPKRLSSLAEQPNGEGIRLFRFYSDREATLGFLLTTSNGPLTDGKLLLFDTDKGHGTSIPLPNCDSRGLWIFDATPPSFALGPVVGLSVGETVIAAKPRMDRVFSFGPEGYRRNPALEARVSAQRFGLTEFTGADLAIFRSTPLERYPTTDDAELRRAERLLDYLHYGKGSGHERQAREIFSLLHPSYRASLEGSGLFAEEPRGGDSGE